MKKYLITGCAGLFGSVFMNYLSNTNNLVIGLDDLSGGYLSNIDEKNHNNFYKIDLSTDYNYLEEIFKKYEFDYVYHFAAYAPEGLSPFMRRHNYNNNLITTINIINLCIKYNIKRLIFTSSMAVYGKGVLPFEESQVPNPVDPYGIAKYACEMDIQNAAEQFGLEYCIIRPHNVFGRNQNIWDMYRNVLGIWMRQVLNNEKITIYGDGEQKRAFSVMDNCVIPLYNAINDGSKNEIINLGGLKEYSLNECSKMIQDITKTNNNIVYLEPRHEVKEAYCEHKKSIDLLGYEEKISLYDGLKDMWDWAKTQPNREVKKWDEYEIEKNIYSYWRNK